MFRGTGAVQCRTQMFDRDTQPYITVATSTHILSLRVATAYKHLGVKFATNVDYEQEVSARLGAARQAFDKMRKPIFLNQAIPQEARLVLFRSLVLSRLLYGCSIWAELSVPAYRKVEAAVVGFYRRICNVGFWQDDNLREGDFLQSFELVSFRIFWAQHRLCYLHHLALHGLTCHKTLLLSEFDQHKGWLREAADDHDGLSVSTKCHLTSQQHAPIGFKFGSFFEPALPGPNGFAELFVSTGSRRRLRMTSPCTTLTLSRNWQLWA